MFECREADGVLQVRRPGTRWLSTGWNGGFHEAPAAYNVTVPEGWAETDLEAYSTERRTGAGFETPGPTLFTGVEQDHARVATAEPVTAVATVGLSNPAPLPIDETPDQPRDPQPESGEDTPPGTVNLIVGTPKQLDDAALANLVSVVAEAKAATLLGKTPFPGTTTDAIIVGSDPSGEPCEFTGSATEIGEAARICVREAILASFVSRYPEGEVPETVAAAAYGRVPSTTATVSRPAETVLENND